MIDLQLLDEILPEELEAPKASFDCEPNMKSKDGTMKHDWTAHMRRQFVQDDLNIQWKERQLIREKFLNRIKANQ